MAPHHRRMDRGFLIGTGLASAAMFAGIVFLTSPATSISPPAPPARRIALAEPVRTPIARPAATAIIDEPSPPPAPGIDYDSPIHREPARVTASNVYYSGCNEVRAAGLAPLYRNQPGYRPEMDGDNDGIACEPRRHDTQF